MITEICEFLRNWFDKDQAKYYGAFSVENGALVYADGTMEIQTGQYYRIMGSVFNDGVHCYGSEELEDETSFSGTVWLMALPPSFLSVVEEINAWMETYGGANGALTSPFASESFAGYAYTKKATGVAGATTWDKPDGWQSVFYSRLRRWKKL